MIIYKYGIDIYKPNVFEWPQSNLLHVENQHGFPFMWVEHFVDPHISQDKTKYTFVVKGTGENFDGRFLLHRATWLDGNYVWHLYQDMQVK